MRTLCDASHGVAWPPLPAFLDIILSHILTKIFLYIYWTYKLSSSLHKNRYHLLHLCNFGVKTPIVHGTNNSANKIYHTLHFNMSIQCKCYLTVSLYTKTELLISVSKLAQGAAYLAEQLLWQCLMWLIAI